MKILLAGTPEFAVPIFEKIINNFEVVGIVSQPDKPNKRGRILTSTPTKVLAQKYNIKCFQPEKIGQIADELKALDYDYLVTAAFGQLIPTSVLQIAKKLNLNVHGSILPKYRGAAPVQHALLNNDKTTGVSLMEMVKAMDAGDVFAKIEFEIDERDTASSLLRKISLLSAEKIVDWLNKIDKGELAREVQDESKVTFSPKLNKEDAEITKDLTCDEAINKIRAYEYNPGAYIHINDKRVKLFFATKKVVKAGLKIDLADGSIYAVDYQFDSKKRVKL
ncbi:methionyl-tRNA formyltransferase [Mycoplasma bovis]|uniref:methionyl-tRNA formyltransferase n=1 Tax=Mycoplasmopsis bovis TaxID=28903 RepID=UPI00175CEE8E|nr:methionyl-tRNA formyltransferase [Mycoplasmopsis bovis]MBT1345607.1 methionyl-tRNA formyltransferase [Mycoplasmopsis bovis]MBT1386458.1 methionyl-tRNA formyltransferase [Mycoplasmopsis bovis]MBT1395634.1 methionyl-tRNA formyltransferase [Mycoplasmopsis bovis]MBT1418740.1 methionyl-tRNA formyltransferase [Mycoplasmopsis bovis]MBT1419531.1 methionyl-tRNA formyltransferase [Mycoplasmopsis bovis]